MWPSDAAPLKLLRRPRAARATQVVSVNVEPGESRTPENDTYFCKNSLDGCVPNGQSGSSLIVRARQCSLLVHAQALYIMATTKSKSDIQAENIELRAELNALKSHDRTYTVASIANTLIMWGGLVLIARYGYWCVDALAGRETAATIIGNIDIKTAFPWLVSIASMGYGLRERRLRKTNIKRLATRNRHLEATIDPTRTTSGLTERGDTNPLDN